MSIDSTSLVVGLLLMIVMGAVVTYIIRICTFEINALDNEKARAEAAKSASESSAGKLVDGPPKAYARIPRTESRSGKG